MKKGLILVNAYSKLKSSLNQSVRLQEEFELLGVKTDIKANDFFAATITDTGDIAQKVKGYDFCVYLDKDKYVSHMLEKCGMRLFNRSEAIELCDDKMVTAIALANNGIRMPSTMAGLLCYDRDEPVKSAALDEVEKNLGYPLIVKTSFGSLGKGVYKADNRAQLNDIANRLKCEPHLYQSFIAESAGYDIRVIVIGGKFVAAMERKSNGDFRSNLYLGGSATAVVPENKLICMCEKAASILKLDYCGVDVLRGDDYYICEVNSNAFFGGMESVTGVNIAKKYAEYIYNNVYQNA